MIFTPRTKDGDRLELDISFEDRDAFNANKELRGITNITDLTTGTRYRVKSAACGLGCFCDARILKTYEAKEVA